MSISEYRKALERSKQLTQESLLSKIRTEQLEELHYQKGFLDGVYAALRQLDETEKSNG